MNADIPNIKAFVSRSTERLLQDKEQTDGLLFMGAWHDTVPRARLQDPALETTEWGLYLVLKSFCSPNTPITFPRYDQLETLTKLSRPTVARAMLVLRATRWLSVCARVRNEQGHFKGHVMALHAEPLSLADAMALDEQYVEFLRKCCGHANPKVKGVAQRIVGGIQGEIINGEPIMESVTLHNLDQITGVAQGNFGLYSTGDDSHPKTHYSQEAEEVNVVLMRSAPVYPEHPLDGSGDESDEKALVKNLNSGSSVKNLNLVENPLVKNFNSGMKASVKNLNSGFNSNENSELGISEALVKNLNSGHKSSSTSSSININKSTTTTTPLSRVSTVFGETEPEQSEEIEDCVFPVKFSPKEIQLAQICLDTLPKNKWQDVLDEMAHHLSNPNKKIDQPLTYLAKLVLLSRQGNLMLSGGLKVRQARETAQQRKTTTGGLRWDAEISALWQRLQVPLRQELGDRDYGKWIAPLQVARNGGRGMVLLAPNAFVLEEVKPYLPRISCWCLEQVGVEVEMQVGCVNDLVGGQ